MNDIFNIRLEAAYLSNLITYQKKPDELKISDFYDEKHRIIYLAILNNGTEIELILNEISKSIIKNIDIYLIGITANSNPIFDFKKAAAEIKKYSIRRDSLKIIDDYKNGQIELFNLISGLTALEDIGARFIPKSVNCLSQDDIKFNGHFPEGEISLIIGNGGIGKTYISIYLAMQFCRDTGRRCLLWLTEDAEGSLAQRVNYISHKYGVGKYDNLSFEFSRPPQIMEKHYGKPRRTTEFTRFINYIMQYDLIFLDPFATFYPLKTNDNDDSRLFFDEIKEPFKKSGKSLVFLHHTSKIQCMPISSDTAHLDSEYAESRKMKAQGASQIVNSARFVCYLETASDDKYIKILSVIKSNVGHTGDVIETLETPHKKETLL